MVGWLKRKLKKAGRSIKRSTRVVKKIGKKVGRIATTPTRLAKRAYDKTGGALYKKVVPSKVRGFVRKAGPTVLKYAGSAAANVPGVGTAAGAALRGASAVAEGKKWKEIAKQAAVGAIPGGPLAQEAALAGINTLERVAQGTRLDKALGRSVKAGGVRLAERYGGQLGAEAARSGIGLGERVARGDRFDKALGRTAVEAASRQGSRQLERVMPASTRLTSKVRGLDPLRGITRSPRGRPGAFGSIASRLAQKALNERPALVRQGATAIARELGLPTAAVNDALRSGAGRGLKWRPLSTAGGQFVKSRAPFARYVSRSDTAGLSPDGKTYTVEDGDNPSKVAQALTGSASRYTELFAANPDKPTVATSYGRNFKYFYSGMVLKLPSSWWPETITAPTPAPGPTVGDDVTAAEVLKSKATLVAWGKTDGSGRAGLTNYGSLPSEAQPAWNERDRLMLKSFVNWRGKGSTDGELRQVDVDELSMWAESKVTAPTPAPTPTPGPTPPVATPPIPTTTPTPAPPGPVPTGVTLPPMTIPGTGIETPSIPLPPMATPPVAAPPLPAPPTPPVAAPPTPTGPAAPPVATPPATPSGGAPPSGGAAKSSGGIGDAAPALAALGIAALLL